MYTDVVVTLILLTAIDHVSADIDPFDMFHDTVIDRPTSSNTPPTADSSSDFIQAPSQDAPITDVEHYRELHKVLTRILWYHLRVVESAAVGQEDTIRIQLTILLKSHDILLLKKYCSQNQSLVNQISPDSVNTLFSRSLQSATMFDTANSAWRSMLSFDISHPVVLVTATVVLSFLLALLRLFPWRFLRRLAAFIVVSLICSQFILRKYNQQLAKKMSVLSQHESGPPEGCKPRHLQSWSYWLSSLTSFRPASDSCASYYEQVITDPLHGTNLYEVLLELVLHPLICISSTTGTCLGVVYHQLTVFMPTSLAFLAMLFVLLVPPFVLIRWYVLCSKVTSGNSANSNSRKQSSKAVKRREKKPLKCNSLPELMLS